MQEHIWVLWEIMFIFYVLAKLHYKDTEFLAGIIKLKDILLQRNVKFDEEFLSINLIQNRAEVSDLSNIPAF